jgi:hypothetical protein
MVNVIQFPHPIAPVQPVAHFIGYHKLANLHAAGSFPAIRIVVDASRLKHQKELVSCCGPRAPRSISIPRSPSFLRLRSLMDMPGMRRGRRWARTSRLTRVISILSRRRTYSAKLPVSPSNTKLMRCLRQRHFGGDPNFKQWCRPNLVSRAAPRARSGRWLGHRNRLPSYRCSYDVE